MAKSKANPEVNVFFEKEDRWKKEVKKLRTLALATGLVEELKWGKPCYTLKNKNVFVIQTFKEYCAILFFQGALLNDPQHILVQQTANVQAARQIRLTSARQIDELQAVISAYLEQAITVQESGAKVKLKTVAEYSIPEEFQRRLNELPSLKSAFQQLTPGRQKGYIFYFSSAKKSETRTARIDKCLPSILNGQGLEDQNGREPTTEFKSSITERPTLVPNP